MTQLVVEVLEATIIDALKQVEDPPGSSLGVVERFSKPLAQWKDESHVIIDLQQVARFGSSFLETLRKMWKVSKVRDGKLALCNVSDIGREILAVTKFDSLWLVCSTMEEALASIAESSTRI